MGLGFNLGDVGHQLGNGQIATEQSFVADHDLLDVRVAVGDLHDFGKLGRVGVGVAVEPSAERNVKVHTLGECRNLAKITLDRVGADVVGMGGGKREVGFDFGSGGIVVGLRAFTLMEGREGEAADFTVIGGDVGDRLVSPGPDAKGDQPRAEPGGP